MKKFDPACLDCLGFPAFVLEVDQKGRAVYAAVNQSWCEGTRRFSLDVVGKTASEIFGGRMGLIAYTQHMEAVETGKPVTYDLMLPNNQTVQSVRTSLTPIVNDQGNVEQVVAVSYDRSAEQNVADLKKNLTAGIAEVEEFISLAAHDLRAPLRNIQNLTELLIEDYVDQGDGKAEILELLHEVSVKASDLISDILSHAQATQAITSHETFDIAQLASDIFFVLDPMKSHRLNAKSQWIKADKSAIQIALRNLCDNAIKHSGTNTVQLSVDTRTFDDTSVEFAVCDNGVGFSNPAVAFLDGGKLRVDSGFGLLGVRRLVNSRGGSIKAENLPNEAGSIVSFTMPGAIVGPPLM